MSRMSKATASWTGKNVLVVGGTQGIGRATAIAFAKGGASVTVTGRDVGRGEALLKDLKAAAPSATMSFEAFDVTSMRNVTSFTERFRKTNEASGLHALVLCAGGLNYGPRRETAEGLEMTFAQNVASRFKLTKDLLPLLRPGATVINCLGAGNGAVLDTQDWELKNNFSFIKAAGQNAAMNDFLALEFGSRFGTKSKAQFFSFYPGVVNTKSVANQNFPWILQLGASLVLPLIGTAPETVADRILKMASEPEYTEGEFGERHAGLIGASGKAIQPLPKYISDYPEVGPKVYDYLDKVTQVSSSS